ncbi:MAG: hypothetical protein A3K19_00585 [Lentisphaerae bacterium RIFOXYB12_FULL_65_16]|nr:MAG: hypothetical protein A3K18_14925 [Lentisphaerae bacterium RIFOXYA12_64_32]OGV86786.1 MAG: hypothetical protein A3K19_00585 [Lentisphaerae bacterium RIFOXYB12_FULL_65_16]
MGTTPLHTTTGKIYAVDGIIRTVCCCCPCQAAIKERQQAFGITTAWSSGDPHNTARLIGTAAEHTYSLAQLKAYVNALCTGASGAFIEGPYTGGASVPTWLPATYANSATTIDELCTLVAAMVYTRRGAGVDTTAGMRQLRTSGTVSGTGESSAAAHAAARVAAVNSWTDAAWIDSSEAYPYGTEIADTQLTEQDPPAPPFTGWVTVARARTKLTVTGMTTEIAKTADIYAAGHLYNRYAGTLIFDGEGTFTDHEYTSVGSFAVSTDAAITTGLIGNNNDPPPDYGPGGASWNLYGWQLYLSGTAIPDTLVAPFAVLEWAFTP